MQRFYATIKDFYAEDERRAHSPELDFGVHWREGGSTAWSETYRVSYVEATGELYAFSNVRGEVELLATLELVPCAVCCEALGAVAVACLGCGGTGNSRGPVDAALEGWADVCGTPDSLAWVRERVAAPGSIFAGPHLPSRLARLRLRRLGPESCPRCGSPDPRRHPAVQFEGEVELCPHPWHAPLRDAEENR